MEETDISKFRQPNNIYECKYCKETFEFQYFLESHIKVCHDKKPYQCHLCPKCFASKSNLYRHIFTHPFETLLGCDFCPMVFKTRSDQIEHMLTCHREKTYFLQLPPTQVDNQTSERDHFNQNLQVFSASQLMTQNNQASCNLCNAPTQGHATCNPIFQPIDESQTRNIYNHENQSMVQPQLPPVQSHTSSNSVIPSEFSQWQPSRVENQSMFHSWLHSNMQMQTSNTLQTSSVVNPTALTNPESNQLVEPSLMDSFENPIMLPQFPPMQPHASSNSVIPSEFSQWQPCCVEHQRMFQPWLHSNMQMQTSNTLQTSSVVNPIALTNPESNQLVEPSLMDFYENPIVQTQFPPMQPHTSSNSVIPSKFSHWQPSRVENQPMMQPWLHSNHSNQLLGTDLMLCYSQPYK